MPSITIIATVLNEADEIRNLLSSLQRQTLTPAQVVIVDGGSTDGTWEQLLAAQPGFPALRPIRDQTCSLQHSPGPIARGRNVAIRAAKHGIIACADAGCRYDENWLAQLTAPLRNGTADYTLGGSRLDLHRASLWDIAAAPFLGVKLAAHEPTKSCTARSMAFTWQAWARTGGFPESLFIGEDVLFDQGMRRVARTVFAEDAKAIYTPRNRLSSALAQVASYAVADGVAGLRPARLLRNLLRSLAGVASLALLPFTVWPLLLFMALEIYFAYRLDWRQVRSMGPAILAGRLLFSLLVPWVVTWNQVAGAFHKQYRTNRQNAV